MFRVSWLWVFGCWAGPHIKWVGGGWADVIGFNRFVLFCFGSLFVRNSFENGDSMVVIGDGGAVISNWLGVLGIVV